MRFFSFKLCIFACLCLRATSLEISPSSPDDSHKNSAPVPELARLNGYRCDIHTVITEDAYVLQVHRLPGGKAAPLNCSLPPVILRHGLLQTSFIWLAAGPSRSLGYLLADEGYDVWLSNVRGNTYCRQNHYFSVDEDDFWDFSWEKSGVLDLSATIDYIVNTTGHEEVLVVAQSQGTTEFFSLVTVRPEYNGKVQHMVAMGPSAFFNYSPSPLTFMAPFGVLFERFVAATTHGEVMPRNSIGANLIEEFCALQINAVFCETLLFSFAGFDFLGFDDTLLPGIFGNIPAGASAKTFLHSFQLVLSRRFQRFDYGPTKNLKVYNSTSPPAFNLSQISTPLSFFYSDYDIAADPTDVMLLVRQLKGKVDLYKVNSTGFNHVDFQFHKNVKTLVNDKVLSIFQTNQILSNKTSCGS